MLQAKSDWNSSKINSMINVLLVFANPSDTHALRLQTEEKVIRDAIRRSNHRDKIILTICPAATIHDVRHAFLDSDKKFQIVQISGHGSTEGLFLEKELGERKVVPKKALADFIQEYCPPIKCVILNACYSASQGRLIFGVPYTIIMEGPIDDEAAIEFSRGFYDAIGAGKSIEFAFGEGCRTVRLTIPNPNFVPELIKKVSVRDEGDRHYSAKRYEEALSKYEKAIQSDLHDAYAWYKKRRFSA